MPGEINKYMNKTQREWIESMDLCIARLKEDPEAFERVLIRAGVIKEKR